MPNNESKKIETVYEQFFLHARHQETQRMMFTVFYGATMSGVLAFLAKLPIAGIGTDGLITNIWYAFSIPIVFLFLFLLSMFGFYLSISLYVPFVIYSRQAELISILEWKVPKELRRFSEIKIEKPSLGYLFSWSYAMMAGITLLLALFTIGVAVWQYSAECKIISLIIISLASIFLLGWLCYRICKRMTKLQKEMSELYNAFNSRIKAADESTQATL